MAIACAILAAGASRRLGQPKQLVTLGGKPLIRHTVELVQAARCGDVAVVLGCCSAKVAAALPRAACELLDNAQWPEGVASSIRVAASWADRHAYAALMLLVCDQIRLTTSHIEQLWQTWAARPDTPVASAYASVRGVPAIFPRAHYGSLQQLRGDRGAAQLLRSPDVSQVVWPDGIHELDTPQDLSRAGPEAGRPVDR